MAEQTFNIQFNGYWRIKSISNLPEKPGIYCVYECTYNAETKTVALHNLFYIDDVDNANEEIKVHKKMPDWKAKVAEGNEICFSFANVDPSDKLRVKAALVNNKKPLLNTEYTNTFPFDRTTINASGRTALLNTFFTVERKDTIYMSFSIYFARLHLAMAIYQSALYGEMQSCGEASPYPSNTLVKKDTIYRVTLNCESQDLIVQYLLMKQQIILPSACLTYTAK